jgi:hypothetical protein
MNSIYTMFKTSAGEILNLGYGFDSSFLVD